MADGQTEPVISFTVPTNGIMHHANFSHGGSHLAIIFERIEGRIVEIGDLTDLSKPQQILTGHATPIPFMGFHPNDTYLATGSTDSTAKVWNLATGQELFTLSGTKGFISKLDYSPDGLYLATAGTDGFARIWNVQPDPPGELGMIGDVSQANDVELSPDESQLAVASSTSPVTIWNVESGAHLLTLGDDAYPFIYQVAFHPDGSRLATVGLEGMVRVWDTESGEELLAFEGHLGGVSGGRLKARLMFLTVLMAAIWQRQVPMGSPRYGMPKRVKNY